MSSKWVPIMILASAQFVMVLDSSVMNVSISQIVEDLDTTVEGVQLAITMYTLVMAAFMLVGAKLGDIWGRERAFAIGLAVYGAGSLTTALSPTLGVLLVGWSLVEGLGAVLVVPAIAALIASNYEGKDRAFAYGIVGGVAAAAVAAGPLIGGWVTTAYSWRLVFVGEVIVVVAILLLRGRMQPSPRPARIPRLDYVGAGLSASGLGLIVFGILQSSTWGWIDPRNAPMIGGQPITPLGFSVVPFLILGGLAILALFGSWEERRTRLGLDALLDITLLKIETLQAGASTILVQQLVIYGTFFVLPVYLQVVLGLDAFETGVKLIPMSAMMLIAALTGPRLAASRSPQRVAQLGLVALALGVVIVLSTIDVVLNGAGFAVGLAVFGVGAGLLASQLANVIMSSVEPARTNEAGGIQGTAQNLGASLGTALIGAVLLTGLTTGFVERIGDNPAIPPDVQDQIMAGATENGLEVVTVEQAEQLSIEAGATPEQATAIAADYGAAQLDGLRRSLGVVAMFAVLGLWFTRRLPRRPRQTIDRDPGPAPPVAASA
ncbi:MAG: MFS transporter [Thermomicrobiales bacterium]|jgi:MFS family permease|nr:MAG: MFS transporter [Thermomicrobiales bacterium]